ncbi:MAG: TonB-dependent receptor [Bacteroidales bacterium]|nr:TonB-dependent receptor [Bacteroidales bacterium]MCQ2141090.1 TonB-dependent receptor [Bacteroidales bacterium]
MKTKLIFCLCLLLSAATAFAQNITVSGTVTEQVSGEPALGVSIVVKGNATTGTIADALGNYSISVPANSTLVFSAIGMKTQEVAVNGRTSIDVQMVEDAELLNEIIVIGYGTAKSKDLTGAISSVKADEIISTPVSSPMGALQGKVAGVQILNSANPGASPVVRVRGVGSFDSSYQGPLYVVDGMFFDNIDFLDSSNIESLTVLKDASSAAIYGVRAANGVILVTTKNGVKGQAKVTYDGYYGIQQASNLLKLANSAEYASLMKEFGDLTAVELSIKNWGGSNGVPTTDTDWYKALLKTGTITSHSVNVSGTTDKASYVLGVSYFTNDGISKGDNNYERFNIISKGDYTPFSWLKAGANITISNATKKNGSLTAFREAFLLPSFIPVYDEKNTDAYPTKYGSTLAVGLTSGYFANPVARAEMNNSRNNYLRILPSLYTELSFIPEKLKYKFAVAQEYNLGQSKNYTPVYYVSGNQMSNTNSLSKQIDYNYNTIIDNTLTYTDRFGKHGLTAMLGQSVRYENYRFLQSSTKKLAGDGSDQYHYISLGDKGESETTDGGFSYRGVSFFGRASYDYDGKYLASATMRIDGSSKFQEKWGYFPSVGLGWVISEEDFMKNQNVFEYLKLRGSWGLLGNDKEPASDGFAGLATNYYNMNNQTLGGLLLENKFSWLKWEVVREINAGLSFTSLGGRLTGELDYYNRLTNNAVVLNTIPVTMETVLANSGKISNSGIELQLGWHDKVGELGYSIDVNATTLHNEVKAIQGEDLDYILTGSAEFRQIMKVGQPMNSFYGYKTNGIWASEAEINAAGDFAKQQGAQVGYLKYVDANGDGNFDSEDRTFLGAPYPKFTYGGNLGFTYKKWDLGLTFYGVSGIQVCNAKMAMRYWAGASMNFTKDFAADHFTASNTGSKNPSVAGLLAAANGQINDYFIEDASYFQLQNIQLGYNMSKLWNKVDARVYVSAQNPLTFFKYQGYTPEIVDPTGLDRETYPMARTFTLGVKITY